MAESNSTSDDGWKTPEETDTEIDFTKSPPTNEELGWKPSDEVFETNPGALDLSLEKVNEGVVSKVCKMRTPPGWVEAPSRPAVFKKSCTGRGPPRFRQLQGCLCEAPGEPCVHQNRYHHCPAVCG
ncbi:hypothetical protein GJ744_011997 [Endocarpon pusillum]|uniref:Uncharacterized protein n=1 Tax=Endocarpon pusillum TaxID=364733 RepID=A0A8H7AR97_9EURO|nr:hypothetical protein GJ744_011997 [Endocarpon pusillum]